MNANVKDILKDTIGIEDVANALGITATLKRSGNRLQGECFRHTSKHGQCFNLNLQQNYYHCFDCNISGDIIKLVQDVQNVDFVAGLKWLTNHFRPDLANNINEKETIKEEIYYKNADFLETLFEYGKKKLYESDNEVLRYLIHDRKYDLEILKKSDFFYFPTLNEIKEKLGETDIKLIGVTGDIFRLAFPYRDRQGIITGIIKRSHFPKGTEINGELKRYDSIPGTRKIDMFGLHNAKKEKELIIVEGYPDCIYFQAMGHNNVVALGQGLLSKDYLNGLLSFGVKRITLALDSDDSGKTNTIRAIELLRQDFDVFVVNEYEGYKDPDEIVREKGFEAFQAILNNAKLANVFLATSTIKKADTKTDKGKQETFGELVSIFNACKNPFERKEVKEITATFFDDQEIDLYFDSLQTIEQKKKRDKELANLLSDSQSKLNQGIEINENELIYKIQEIETNYLQLKQKTSNQNWFETLLEREKKQENIELLGYKLSGQNKDFYPIEKDLDGIQSGLYILGAQTNIGKTAFVANVAWHLICNNDLQVIYFSLDDNKSIIASRIRSCMSFVKKDDLSQNLAINDFRKHLDNVAMREKKERINKTFKSYVDSKKLLIYDISDTSSLNEIELIIRQRMNETKNICIVIDGIYNASVSNEIAGKREENIERANKIKQIVDCFEIPVICTVELRKRSNTGKKANEITIDDIMETGKFGYNANLIWLLQAGDKDEQNNDQVTLKLETAKNKLTSFKGYHDVKYFRRYAKMFVEWHNGSFKKDRQVEMKKKKDVEKNDNG